MRKIVILKYLKLLVSTYKNPATICDQFVTAIFGHNLLDKPRTDSIPHASSYSGD